MKKPLWAVPFVLLLCFPFACRREQGPPPSAKTLKPDAGPDLQADIAAVRALIDEWVRLYNATDFAGIMAVFYTDDAVLMPPGAPTAEGKDAILGVYQKDDEVNIELVETSVVDDVRLSGDLAVARGRDTGTTTARKDGKSVPYDLKWVMAFKRQPDRSWKCCYEIWCDNPLSKTP